MDACDYRHFLTATRQYHALWLGIHPEGLTGTGIELQACEDRRMAQTGYSKPFTILGFVSRRRTVVSYHPDFAVSIRQAVLQYDPIDPISSLRYGLETAFGVKASVGNKYYFAGPLADVPTEEARALTLDDLGTYKAFFELQHGTDAAGTWLGEYFEKIVRCRLCWGIHVDGDLVSATDAPDIPYLSDQIVEPGINTLAGFRGRGFATKVCAAMIGQILSDKKAPVWSCRSSNIASSRLAERLGFRMLGQMVSITNADTPAEAHLTSTL